MAKKLAKEVFGDESNLIRFDMSEFSDKSSVSKLIGSNPGYIGYEEGGRLTEAVKNKKYCVLLLDDIEKALSAPVVSGKPRCILAHTVKGKGVSFMENQAGWHGKAPNEEQRAQALRELEG